MIGAVEKLQQGLFGGATAGENKKPDAVAGALADRLAVMRRHWLRDAASAIKLSPLNP